MGFCRGHHESSESGCRPPQRLLQPDAVNRYPATFSGFICWCENNHYCEASGKHCIQFTKSSKAPAPLSYDEYNDGEYNYGKYNCGKYNCGEYNCGEYNCGKYNVLIKKVVCIR
ncbi:hypothetical protein [Dickeya fangzhongdai]|uniref:hypothetical protein n=1 Tax=Dickeya fangzhongdai TaxID=1778540 RepID=UPI003307987E